MTGSGSGDDSPIKTIEAIWADNVMTREEVAAFFPPPAHGPRHVEAPERVRRTAKTVGDLPDGIDEWLETDPARRPWLVIMGTDVLALEAIAVAAMADPRCGRPRDSAALRRAVDLLAEHDAAPLFGPGNGTSVMAAWTRIDALAIGGLGHEDPPVRSAPLLAELLERRLDECRCTLLLETEPGKAWLDGLARGGASREDRLRIVTAIALGTNGRKPIKL